MSQVVKNWTDWLNNTRFSSFSEEQRAQTFGWLFSVRDRVLANAKLNSGNVVVDIGTGTGLLAFGAYDILHGSGLIIASDKFSDCTDECRQIAQAIGIKSGFETLVSPADKLDLPDCYADRIVMRSVLVHILDKEACIKEFFRVLKPGGILSFFEPIMSSNTKYSDLVRPEEITDYEKFKDIEYDITHDKSDPITNFDEIELKGMLEKTGFSDINIDEDIISSTYVVDGESVPQWFNSQPSPGSLSLKGRFLKYVSEEVFERYLLELRKALHGREITVSTRSVYISAVK